MGEAEKSSQLGIVQIILQVIAGVLCFAVLVASVITISTLDDVFENIDSSYIERRYRGVAGWLVFLGVAGIIIEIVMVIFRGLYFGQVISERFAVFGIVNAVFSFLFALGLIAGGAVSAANTADIQEALDLFDSESICDSPPDDHFAEICDDLEQLRNSMAAATALSFLGVAIFFALNIIARVDGVKSRQ